MREIKFRAWHKKTNQVLYGLEKSPSLYQIFEGDAFEPMQYTGLKDKNGKEIYEGDILDFGDYSIAKFGCWPHIVYWNDEGAAFNTREIGFQKLAGFSIDETGEVIGNIYDNPELLK